MCGGASSEMFLSIQELAEHEIVFREKFDPGVIDLGADVRQRGLLQANGRAELIEEQRGHKHTIDDIHLAGEVSASLELPCARCLQPVVTDVLRPFDLMYRPLGADAGQEELSINQGEADIGYYTGEGLQLEDVVREQVLLALPIKVVCTEACKGLCPTCGQNLNQGACGCPEPAGDVRWRALEGIRDKIK